MVQYLPEMAMERFRTCCWVMAVSCDMVINLELSHWLCPLAIGFQHVWHPINFQPQREMHGVLFWARAFWLPCSCPGTCLCFSTCFGVLLALSWGLTQNPFFVSCHAVCRFNVVNTCPWFALRSMNSLHFVSTCLLHIYIYIHILARHLL